MICRVGWTVRNYYLLLQRGSSYRAGLSSRFSSLLVPLDQLVPPKNKNQEEGKTIFLLWDDEEDEKFIEWMVHITHTHKLGVMLLSPRHFILYYYDYALIGLNTYSSRSRFLSFSLTFSFASAHIKKERKNKTWHWPGAKDLKIKVPSFSTKQMHSTFFFLYTRLQWASSTIPVS